MVLPFDHPLLIIREGEHTDKFIRLKEGKKLCEA
jgi:hypothetical protein